MRIHRAGLALFGLWAGAALGQAVAPLAAQQFERDVAACQQAGLAAPAREACVRAAGERLDRARGVLPADTVQTSPDGRASVVTPPGERAQVAPAEPVPTEDGRASVIPAR